MYYSYLRSCIIKISLKIYHDLHTAEQCTIEMFWEPWIKFSYIDSLWNPNFWLTGPLIFSYNLFSEGTFKNLNDSHLTWRVSVSSDLPISLVTWTPITSDSSCYLKVKQFHFHFPVQSSNGLWCFACGDVYANTIHF